jgi:hypothetical protein
MEGFGKNKFWPIGKIYLHESPEMLDESTNFQPRLEKVPS